MDQRNWLDRAVDNGTMAVYRALGNAVDFVTELSANYDTARELGEGSLDAFGIALSKEPRAEAQRGLLREAAYQINSRPTVRQETIVAPYSGFASLLNVIYRWKEYRNRDKKEREDARRHRQEVLSRYKDKWTQLKTANVAEKAEPADRSQVDGQEPRATLKEDIGEVYSELRRLTELYNEIKQPTFLGFTKSVGEAASKERDRKIREAEGELREIGQYALDIGHAGLIAEVEQALGERYTDEQVFTAFRNHAYDTRGFGAGLSREELEALEPAGRWEQVRRLQASAETNGRRKQIADINQTQGETSFSVLYDRLFADDIDRELFRLEEGLEQGLVNRVLTTIYGTADKFLEDTKLEPRDREEFGRLLEEARDFSTVDFMDYFDLEESPETLVRGGVFEQYAPLFWPAFVGLAGTDQKALDLKDGYEDENGQWVTGLSKQVDRYIFGQGRGERRVSGLKDLLLQYRTAAVLNILGAQNLEEARRLVSRGKVDTLGQLAYFGVLPVHRITEEVFLAADMLGEAAGDFYRNIYSSCLGELAGDLTATMREGIARSAYDGMVLRRFRAVLAGFESARNTRFVQEAEPEKVDLVVKDAEQTAFNFGRGVVVSYLGFPSEVFTSHEAQGEYRTNMNFLQAMISVLNGDQKQAALDLKKIDFAVRKKMSELTGV